MIKPEVFFDDMAANLALWCDGGRDTGELARVADAAASQVMPVISALPSDVPMLWTWLEKTPARIYSRFYLPARGPRDVNVMSDLSARINATFKQGAHGAQIFMRAADLSDFADEIGAVRDDLFFNRELAVGIDIADVGPFEWNGVFDAIRRLRAEALVLVLTRDTGDKSDFVGRLYAAVGALADLKCDLHFVLGNNPARIEQAGRMVRAMRLDMAGGVRIFIHTGGGEL
ncbi:MAG: hypothetical protein K2I81_03975 [Alphaproteobacteria bacterium]|nr:hypothetical protein [Alphaproteobacteria bacterium]